jgi:NAD(P)-dependent dehydrogenase (short-subunit alcohol dehydrogenase family)
VPGEGRDDRSCPGDVESADVTADALAIQSLKRFVDPEDIAALAVFLASDSAKSISGQTIPMDGDSKAAQ